jgi:hypothetical protein
MERNAPPTEPPPPPLRQSTTHTVAPPEYARWTIEERNEWWRKVYANYRRQIA